MYQTHVCPPVVEYSRELQVRAAEELARLPDGSAVVEMMAVIMRSFGSKYVGAVDA